MKPSKRVYDAEAAAPVVVSQPPLAGKGYTTGGAPQTIAAPAGASLGTVQPVPVNTSKSTLILCTCIYTYPHMHTQPYRPRKTNVAVLNVTEVMCLVCID